jgi:hypothetical protein
MPWLEAFIVPARIVDCNSEFTVSFQFYIAEGEVKPVIPQCARPRTPLEPHLDIRIAFIHIVQIPQNQIALGLVQANNPHCHGAVHPQCLPPSGWVCAYQGMFSLDILRPSLGVLAV